MTILIGATYWRSSHVDGVIKWPASRCGKIQLKAAHLAGLQTLCRSVGPQTPTYASGSCVILFSRGHPC